jgi:hypothetical protein
MPIAPFKIKGNTQVEGNLTITNQTASTVLTTDASKNVVSSNVTSTELGHLSGVTSSVQTQLNAKINSTEKGAANGVASLDSTGKIPAAQLPASAMEYKGAWNASTNSPTLADGTGDAGDIYRVSVAGTQNLGSGSITFVVGDLLLYNGTVWQRSPASDAPVLSVNGQTGVVVLTKSDVGLSNVDNTSDLNKPISTATQTALNGKANTVHTHALTDLTHSSATNGQVPTWNGTSWVAATPATVITDHTLLTNIGTNTHAQIDTHIAASANVHGVGAGNSVVGTGTTQTLTNKTIDADLNTITNIENADIKTGAAIARNKLASGTANHVIINDGTGVMSSEAALAASRGGLGTSGAAFTGVVKAATGVFSASTIVDADVAAAAAIARTKIANGTVNHVVINNASGTLTSEAALAASRGGLGTSAAAFTGLVKAATGVFSAATLVDADVSASAAIARTKIANGTANRLVVNNATGVMTDAAAITAARALISDANGIPTHSTVTSTELGFVSGVTSAIQTQLNAKANISAGDIAETAFNMANNQSVAANVTGFAFANATVRSFEALVSVEISALTNLFEVFTIRGIQKGSQWDLSVTSNGDGSGVIFDITATGQVTYQSSNIAGYTAGKIKFRAFTTTIG